MDTFLDISSCDTSVELSIQQEWGVIMNRFNEVDIADKVNIKAKLHEIVYPDKTFFCPPSEKVKTKGGQKKVSLNFLDERSEFLLTLNMLISLFHDMIVLIL